MELNETTCFLCAEDFNSKTRTTMMTTNHSLRHGLMHWLIFAVANLNHKCNCWLTVARYVRKHSQRHTAVAATNRPNTTLYSKSEIAHTAASQNARSRIAIGHFRGVILWRGTCAKGTKFYRNTFVSSVAIPQRRWEIFLLIFENNINENRI